MKCPNCGALEVDAIGPRTVYGCDSSSYDDRPGTWITVCSINSNPTMETRDEEVEKFLKEFDEQFRIYTFSRKLTPEEIECYDPEDFADEGGDPYESAEPRDMENWLRVKLTQALLTAKTQERERVVQELAELSVKKFQVGSHGDVVKNADLQLTLLRITNPHYPAVR